MSKRLAILQQSLIKKQQALDERIENHFQTVKMANGQPLNDKRNGYLTLKRWSKQEQSIQSLQDSIKKTKQAITREQAKIDGVNKAKDKLPECFIALINDGVITQWRKHPNYFFVDGVDKARIIYDAKKNKVLCKYVDSLRGNQAQFDKFKQVFNSLKASIEK